MHNRDDYEPIIATRPSRKPQREETQPLWRVVLVLCAGLAGAVLLAWWWIGRSSSDGASTTAQSESSAPEIAPEIDPEIGPEIGPETGPETGPEIQVEQDIVPPARDPVPNTVSSQEPVPPPPATESAGGSEQAATPENIPEVVPADEPQMPAAPAPVSVRFMSPDPQVRIELIRPPDSSPLLTSKAGDVVAVPQGTYRVVASGTQLETFEQEVVFDGERPLEYTLELCAEPKRVREDLAGQVVEERACASTAECESLFLILGEYADQLVKDRGFRTQQCGKWRANAAPEGSWTLNINCDGATPATTCRVSIAEGACTFAESRRSMRGGACPRAELE